MRWDRWTTLPLPMQHASAASMRICDPLLPVFANEFNVPLASAAATTNGFALAYGLCQFFLGPIGDRYGMGAFVNYEQRLGDIKDSPLIEDDYIWRAGVIGVVRFNSGD